MTREGWTSKEMFEELKKRSLISFTLKDRREEYDNLVQICDVGLIFLNARFTIPNFPSRLLSYTEIGKPVLAATDENTDIGKIIEEEMGSMGKKMTELGDELNEKFGSGKKKVLPRPEARKTPLTQVAPSLRKGFLL